MKYVFICTIYLSATILFFSNELCAQPANPCKKVTIQFEQKLKNVPLTVYYKGNVVGTASALPTPTNKPQEVTACINEKSAMTIEKNALCYIQNEQIVIFNIWSAGVLLKENTPMSGFADWTSALFYFVKELPRIIYETAMDFGMGLIGTVIDKNIGTKTKA